MTVRRPIRRCSRKTRRSCRKSCRSGLKSSARSSRERVAAPPIRRRSKSRVVRQNTKGARAGRLFYCGQRWLVQRRIARAIAARLVLHEDLGDLRMPDRLVGIVRQQVLFGDIGDVFGLRIFREQVIERLVLVRPNFLGDRQPPFLGIVEFRIALTDREHPSMWHAIGVAVRQIALNPLIMSAVAGALAAALHIQLPVAIGKTLLFLQNAAAPTALFVLGVTVALRPFDRVPWEVPGVIAIKLLIHPLIVFGLMLLFGPFAQPWAAKIGRASCRERV